MSLFSRTTPSPAQRSSGWAESPNQMIPSRLPYFTAGQPVTHESALTKVPLLAATNLVADMPSILGVGAYTGHGGARRQVQMPANIKDPEANGYGLADFAYKYISQRILRGNVFIRVDDVDSNLRPQVVTVMDPDDVVVHRDQNSGEWIFVSRKTGKQMYLYRSKPKGGLIHRRAFPQPGSVMGLSVVGNHARAIGLSLSAEQFGADFFADGAHPSGILSTEQAITEDQARTIKQRFVNAIRGSREPAVLGAGIGYSPIQIAPNESMFLETQKFSASELCRMVGPGCAEMLGYETGGTMTYQNVQSRSLHLLIYTVDKWVKDLERCLSNIFVPRGTSIEFDRNGLLRMTSVERWKVHREELQLAALTINEVRATEGLEPVPWGDEPFLPSFGETGTASAQAQQIEAEEELGKDIPEPVKIGGVHSS